MNPGIDAILNRARKVRDDLALPEAAKAESRRDKRTAELSDPGIAVSVAAALDWLGAAQDNSLSNDGGIARDYSLVAGWRASYPETSGYIVPTLLRGHSGHPADVHRERARVVLDWLVSIQNADGGWGEDATSYRLDYKGFEGAPTTASQTAWALLGLMAVGEVGHPSVARGVKYLIDTQTQKGLWDEQRYTATGFPRVFYLRYHGYPKFFPLWALARYRNLKNTNIGVVGVGM